MEKCLGHSRGEVLGKTQEQYLISDRGLVIFSEDEGLHSWRGEEAVASVTTWEDRGQKSFSPHTLGPDSVSFRADRDSEGALLVPGCG